MRGPRVVVPELPHCGVHLGRWELLEPLGRGGMAEVWRARDPRTGEQAALKLARGEWAEDEEGRARFLREAKALRDLAHPGLVRWLDAGHGPGGAPWFAMELLPGGTLAERVSRKGPLEPREVAVLGCDLARALSAVHAQGLIHRDVKPSNVMFARDGRARLTDLGLVRPTSRGNSLTHEGDLLGSPGYLAPEQARAAKDQLGPATDVYGLGATLYCALTGDPPFRAREAMARVLQALLAPVEPPSARRAGIPPGLEAIVMRCLARAPEERWASASQLSEALERWLAGNDPAAPSGRRRALLLAGILAAASALGLLVRPAAPGAAPAPALDPASAEAATWALRAEACMRVGDQAGATQAIERALALDPEQPRALTVRAWERMLHGDNLAGLEDVERAIARDPTLAVAWARRGTARARLRRPGALEDAERAIALQPDQALSWIARALVRAEVGSPGAALADVERALELDPGHVAAWLTRGYLRAISEDAQGARADLERAVELAPGLGQAWLQLAHARRIAGDLPGAIQGTQRALELDPLLDGWGLLAECWLETPGQSRAALEAASRGIEQDPRRPRCWAARASAWLQLERADPAIEDATRALELDPECYTALTVRGTGLAVKGDLRGARTDFLRAADLPLVLAHPDLQRYVAAELERLR